MSVHIQFFKVSTFLILFDIVTSNFSDDRSAEVFKQKIDSAVQMQSVLDGQNRPNCLVIDEIDGAPTVRY